MLTKERGQYFVELPKGIPVLTGHFGTVVHKPSRERHLLFFHEWDLLFVEKGQAIFQLRNQKPIRIPVGHFLLLPPSFPVWLRCTRPSRLSYCHFSLNPIPDNVFPSVRSDCLEIGRRVLIPWTFSKSEAHKIWLAYRRVVAMDFNATQPWRMACAVSQMVSELGAFALKLNLPDDQPLLGTSEGPDPRVIDVCRRIARSPFLPWKVSELAKSFGISTGHLDRLFRSNLRMKLKGFIVERRMQRALQFFDRRHTDSRKSIKEISVNCGFSSQHFFSRQFKKFYGIPPSKYRSRETKR